jgi:hypothetical protein
MTHPLAEWYSTKTITGAITSTAAATNFVKAEDAAHASGDGGVPSWRVRVDDASVASPSASGDYTYSLCNRKGATAVVPYEHTVRAYRSAFLLSSFAAAATDLVDIFGNASTTVEIRRIMIHGLATSASETPIYLTKRTTANSGGTRVAQTAVRMNTADTAASSAPGLYTANPTTGTTEGTIGAVFLPLQSATGSGEGGHEWVFGNPTKAPTLIGTGQGLAINYAGGTAPAGLNLLVEIEWVEYVA